MINKPDLNRWYRIIERDPGEPFHNVPFIASKDLGSTYDCIYLIDGNWRNGTLQLNNCELRPCDEDESVMLALAALGTTS